MTGEAPEGLPPGAAAGDPRRAWPPSGSRTLDRITAVRREFERHRGVHP